MEAGAGQILMEPLQAIWYSLITVLPNLIAAIILLIIGYIIGSILGKGLTALLKKVGLDRWLHETKLTKNVGKMNMCDILGDLLKWLIFLVFLTGAVDLVDIAGLSEILNKFVAWIPNLIIAILVILFGMMFANWLEVKIDQHSKVRGIRVFASVLKWVIVIMVAITSLRQIGVDVAFLENALLLVIGALAVGIALALGIGLGLGMKKESEGYVKGIMKNF